MDIKQKIELNRKIKNYEGDNNFIHSLKRSFNSKWIRKESNGNRQVKVLSDKQYEAAHDFFNS